MSIIYLIEQLEGRTGGVSGVGAFAFRKRWRGLVPRSPGVDEYHQVNVLLDFIAQTGVRPGAQWIYGYGTPAYEWANIYCTELTATDGRALTYQGGYYREWIFEANYEPCDPAWFGPAEVSIPEDPTQAPIRLERGEWTEQYVYPYDNQGHAFINTAGDMLADTPSRERHHPTVRLTRRERTFDDVAAAAYRDSVNSVSWTVAGVTYPPRYAKCVSINPGEMRFHQDLPPPYVYYEVVYEFAIKPTQQWTDITGTNFQGWDDRFANVGYRQKAGGSTVPILDANGQPVNEPRPLNGTGGAYSVPLAASQAMPMIGFRFYNEVDFNQLGFPAGLV